MAGNARTGFLGTNARRWPRSRSHPKEITMSEAAATASTPVFELNGARATIRLNRPKHLNRLQPDDLDALMKLFDRIEADLAIRVMVLTGTGRAFSAGYDLNSVAERATSAVEEKSAGS